MVDPPSDAEVIGRSLDEPEAFGLIYDRHAATLLRFLGRRVGAEVAEGLLGELFRIAFERRKTFDAARASALPWLYGIGSNLLMKHRRGEARGPGEEAAARGRVRAGRARPGKGDAHGDDPAGGRAPAPTYDRSPASVSGHRRRARVPGTRVRVPRDPDRTAGECGGRDRP